MLGPTSITLSSVTALHYILVDSVVNAEQFSHVYAERYKYEASLAYLPWSDAEIIRDALNLVEASESIASLCRRVSIAYVESDLNLRSLAGKGRSPLSDNLSEDEKEVLSIGGLLDTIVDDECLAWWDKLRSENRVNSEAGKRERGRQAEKLTLQNEIDLLLNLGVNEKPVWVALDSDQFGYDIKSYRLSPDEELQPILIEVKSFAKASSPVLFLTRNEWVRAKQYADSYRFCVWCMESLDYVFLSVGEIENFVPTNNQGGRWETASIRGFSHPCSL